MADSGLPRSGTMSELPLALTEDRRATLRALELSATLGHFGTSLDTVESEASILAETAAKLGGLLDFTCLSFFMVNDVTFGFDLAWTSAPEQADDLQQDIAGFIEDRTFAWALGRNKPTLATSQRHGRFVLHPLAAASGPLGMFAGVLRSEEVEHSADIGFYLLTVTLFSAATQVENFRLFRDLESINATLEKQVEERTASLMESNIRLRRTLHEKEGLRRDLEAVFSSMQDPLITVDVNRRITRVNRAGASFFREPAHQLEGRLFNDVFPQGAEPCSQVFRSAIDNGMPVREFRTTCREDGVERALILSCSPLIPGQSPEQIQPAPPAGAVLLIRDITRLVTLEKQLKERHSFRNIVGRSERMQKLYALLETLADVDTTVLVTGESGTGKELIADALHHNGARANGPLIKVNCTALSESLLESELFGHVRGSFTGAVSDKAGRFEAAEGGTIFLDEIGDVSLRIQVLLLRFLESKEFERVGDTVTRKADVRIVAATNANLTQKIQQGSFRADLYYRLNVMHVQLPSLRERRDDIPLLINHFISLCNKELGTAVTGIADEALQFLMRHPWPGNVRELKHVVEHGCILTREGHIGVEHLASDILGHTAPATLPAMVPPHVPANAQNGFPPPIVPTPAYNTPAAPRAAFHDLSADDILHAIQSAQGNKAHAARLLGIGRATLYRKIRELGITA